MITGKASIYEAIIKVEDKIVFKTDGDDLDHLIASLSVHCESEKSGAEAEIIEVSTHNIVYRCHKQSASYD
ncbi:Uncharacterised protein [Legionella busanensis]|uniref:Uncharacterized protein n=1 Tax=Legionella busanensis TaxID=190655 RepID=A0A378JIC2_9GAMM|nr:hypothetical protein [Legionella busanensis]STX50418.1 Uncharacterised protein [Legionella busanensis]